MSQPLPPRPVYLDLRGEIIKTDRDLLTSVSGYFECLLSSRWTNDTADGSSRETAIFIDKNPRYFHEILDFIQDPRAGISSGALVDLDYYNITVESESLAPIADGAENVTREELIYGCKDATPNTGPNTSPNTDPNISQGIIDMTSTISRSLIQLEANRLGHTPQTIPCSLCFNSDKMTRTKNAFFITLPRRGDAWTGLTIIIKHNSQMLSDKYLRYKALDRIVIDANYHRFFGMTGQDLFMYDTTTKTKAELDFDMEHDPPGFFMLTIPIPCLNIHTVPYTNININILPSGLVEFQDVYCKTRQELYSNECRTKAFTGSVYIPYDPKPLTNAPPHTPFQTKAATQVVKTYHSQQFNMQDNTNSKIHIPLYTQGLMCKFFIMVTPINDNFNPMEIERVDLMLQNSVLISLYKKELQTAMSFENIYSFNLTPSYLNLYPLHDVFFDIYLKSTRETSCNVVILLEFYDLVIYNQGHLVFQNVH